MARRESLTTVGSSSSPRPISWLLTKLYNLLGNWGLAIILLTIIIRGTLWPHHPEEPRIDDADERNQPPAQKSSKPNTRTIPR